MSRIDRDRRNRAFDTRLRAAELSRDSTYSGDVEGQQPNGDEKRFSSSLLASFTKGLPHARNTGLIRNIKDFEDFKRAANSGDVKLISALPLGVPEFGSGIAQKGDVGVRGWDSMAAGLEFDLEGPDAQRPAMPSVPKLDSIELAFEMSESYWMALLRDVRFRNFTNGSTDPLITAAVNALNKQLWVRNPEADGPLSDAEKVRRVSTLSSGTVFRGIFKGDNIGPYLSQFLLIGSTGIGNGNAVTDGFIQYGSLRIDQHVRVAVEKLDYMTSWEAWLDVQNAADVRRRERYVENGPRFRFITTPRDLATYVHFDALYEAYLNACLILLGLGVPPKMLFDKGLPFIQDDAIDKQTGFATFGPPHILTLVTEVATRALKAVRFQKFNTHRRARPEAIAGVLDGFRRQPSNQVFKPATRLNSLVDSEVVRRIGEWNTQLNTTVKDDGIPRSSDFDPVNGNKSSRTFLLPMAFPEGSPMHPSYGSGHATVAGACTTILKAFFNHELELGKPYVASQDGTKLEEYKNIGNEKLTVEGELNKLCSNIGIGRNWAGVHWRTDYIESTKLGEEIALGILREQKLTYGEQFTMTVPLFDNRIVRI